MQTSNDKWCSSLILTHFILQLNVDMLCTDFWINQLEKWHKISEVSFWSVTPGYQFSGFKKCLQIMWSKIHNFCPNIYETRVCVCIIFFIYDLYFYSYTLLYQLQIFKVYTWFSASEIWVTCSLTSSKTGQHFDLENGVHIMIHLHKFTCSGKPWPWGTFQKVCGIYFVMEIKGIKVTTLDNISCIKVVTVTWS